jgi:uroporphyrinogen III methyltransferase / synthase
MRSHSPAPPFARLAGPVVFIGCDPAETGTLAWPARAALDAADVVLYDPDAPASVLDLVPKRCFAEPAGGPDAVVSRAARLAGDGWRVVRLVAGDPTLAEAAFDEAERLLAAGIETRTLSGSGGADAGEFSESRRLSTALNGLAG